MTAKELIAILQNLPEDQNVLFSLRHTGNGTRAIEVLKENISRDEDESILDFDGYERLYTGKGEDELFIFKFYIVRM